MNTYELPKTSLLSFKSEEARVIFKSMYYLQGFLAVLMFVRYSADGADLREPLCLVGDFASQLDVVLGSQALTSRDNASFNQLLDDARATLRNQWTDFEFVPFGSLVSGLGTKRSDIDCYVRVPNYNISDNDAVTKTTVELFERQASLYFQVMYKVNIRAYLTFCHIPTQKCCDITYTGAAGVENSRLIRYYLNLDERFLRVARMIKLWSNAHYITGHGCTDKPRNYAIYILTVFYLQQKQSLPSVYELQRDSKSYVVDGSDMSFNAIPYTATNKDNIYQLLGGFFKYYSEFNFKDYIVSPFVGRPLLRSSFLHIDKVPEEFVMYKKNVTLDGIAPLELDSDLCIQDLFEHNKNVVVQVPREEASTLVAHIKLAARLYEELPSDRFLKAVLTQYHEDKITDARGFNDTIQQLKHDSYYNCINITIADL